MDTAKAQKRNLLIDEIDELKTKKKRLAEAAASLSKSADELALKAENARSGKTMREMLAKSNSHRKSLRDKLEECKSVEGMLN